VLRIREPQLLRPFRVPGGMFGVIAVAVGPIALLLIALIKNRGEQLDLGRLGNVSQLGFGLILMAMGVVYYFVAGKAKPEFASRPEAEAQLPDGAANSQK
jgi:hypothetical protein